MGLRLIGYGELSLLRASSHARVYAAIREADARPVVAKVFDLSPGEAEVEARVEHEFSLLEALQVEGVIRPLALERVGFLAFLTSLRCSIISGSCGPLRGGRAAFSVGDFGKGVAVGILDLSAGGLQLLEGGVDIDIDPSRPLAVVVCGGNGSVDELTAS